MFSVPHGGRRARFAWPALVLLSGCTLSTAPRYRALLDEAHRAPAPAPAIDARTADDEGDAVFRAPVLDRGAVVRAVLARNPGLASSRAALRGALARYREATAFDDPMLSYSFAPLSIGSSAVPFGQKIEIAQKLPFPGKRDLRGEIALAEAEAAKGDVDRARLELAVVASKLYDDDYVAARALEINAQHVTLLRDLKASAIEKYAAGMASQQDALEAEVELAHLEHQRIVLETDRDLVVEQLNGLLHRDPDAPLPPPPRELPIPDAAPGAIPDLAKAAIGKRPELASIRARVERGEAEKRLARREYWPDFTVMASYDSMWAMWQHQWMVGVSLDVPLQRGRRAAAVERADADILRAKSELAEREDAVRVEVARAARKLAEAKHVVHLYGERLVPVARDTVSAARAGFIAGKNGFVAVIEAEKNLRTVELQLEQARADVYRRAADLARALGTPAHAGEGGAR